MRQPACTRDMHVRPPRAARTPQTGHLTTKSRVNRKDHTELSSSRTKDDIVEETETSPKGLKPVTDSTQKLGTAETRPGREHGRSPAGDPDGRAGGRDTALKPNRGPESPSEDPMETPDSTPKVKATVQTIVGARVSPRDGLTAQPTQDCLCPGSGNKDCHLQGGRLWGRGAPPRFHQESIL